ncbi:hypothetical protein Pfo_007417 [Paulownia fortunei]|nr:hypothetical protein Pfo_007417 [Paulownia fortunei]
MSSSKIRKLKSIFTANGGCGCGPTDIIEPIPKSKTSSSDQKPSHCPSSSDSSWERHGGGKSIIDDEDYTSTTFSLNIDTSPAIAARNNMITPNAPKRFAIVKDSEDPYQDFRQSMIQMIFEKEIYSRNDLQQLLDCFLQLNSPEHHEVIVRAFMEIWNGGFPATGDADPAVFFHQVHVRN